MKNIHLFTYYQIFCTRHFSIYLRKVLSMIYKPIFDSEMNEWKKLYNYKFQMQFERPDIVKEIAKRRLM